MNNTSNKLFWIKFIPREGNKSLYLSETLTTQDLLVPIGVMSRVFANGLRDWGSIPD